MKNTIQLSIKNPCSENFNDFNKTEKSSFCTSCKKEVIDFRTSSDSQILDYFKNNAQKTCGYFNQNQLKKYTKPQEQPQLSKFYFMSAFLFSVFSLLSSQTIVAQETPSKITTEIINSNQKQTLKNINSMNTLNGVVYNSADNLPLPGVSIVLKNTIIGTDTDYNGNFKLSNIKEGDSISFYSLGFKSQDIIIKKNQTSLKIIMQEDSTTLDPIVLVGAVDVKSTYKTKRPFWQRVKSIF